MPIWMRRVYAIELDDPDIVYVGQTGKPLKERFQEHVSGYKSSRHVRKAKKPKLRPDLYSHYPEYVTVKESEAAEKRLARELKKKGFTVYGGH